MLGFLIVVVALVMVYQKNLTRLYTAVTLYDQDKIANNFLTMYQSFNATTIPASTQPFSFPVDTKDLPDSFEYDVCEPARKVHADADHESEEVPESALRASLRQPHDPSLHRVDPFQIETHFY